jgi:hypothetical protein
MKKPVLIFLFFLQCLLFSGLGTQAQCSLCTKTAQQLGEKPAQGLNSGILYLMAMPFVVVGFIGFKWWKNNKAVEATEQ